MLSSLSGWKVFLLIILKERRVYMRVDIKEIFKAPEKFLNKEIEIEGWIKNFKVIKNLDLLR